jgi:YbgC/YbaW family acyl-CoA thioester hydrolase
MAAHTTPFRLQERVRWIDCDDATIIYYGSYIRFFEIAETEMYLSVGLPYSTAFERLVCFPIRAAYHCDYRSPARLDDLMDISRITQNRMELRLAPVPLAGILRSAAQDAAPMMTTARHTLEVSLCDEDVVVDADTTRLTQVVVNLLTNAAKYTPQGGRVTIAISERSSGAEISVSDTGPGIPADERARVVERFVRLEASRSSPGTGLGLALVAAVSRLHGAVLLLEDNKPGLKAIIRFSRSARMPHPGTAEKSAEAAQGS